VIYSSSAGDIGAYTYAETYPSVNVPAGYIGVLARAYRNDALCSQEGYDYNSSKLAGISTATFTGCGHGTYYSYGVSRAYNGNGYNSVYTFRSPSLNN